ncbi:hypothetical protein BO94DRAFT_610303 [Aspergillus sclerotioniger CBS 115572]|uniref:Uncharacterized protein n=1 Tax=Aspergillus sclerotioniger CBS 115572 TaxID=1450535 RepID=A0A317X807_9EURO|nr:hypothetical protein BO94DRAFT_610303 [Aspergillus sclerotioniger CBS 115572]PWY94756.1 hypothetical protein BO94DRAFT_610303 [Aspergillus sclerotioniger CBS 115572]
MRHHILPILLTLTLPPLATTSQTTTTTDLTAQICPSFHNTCPPNNTTTTTPNNQDPTTHIHPRTHHRPIPKPIPIPITHQPPTQQQPRTFPLHPGTCQSIPVTPSTTHVSFDTQIEGSASHCNVTLHELPGCVDTPLLTTRVEGDESGEWVGSECAERTDLGGDGSGSTPTSGDVNMNVWVMLECDASSTFTPSTGGSDTLNQHGDENEDEDNTSNGNIHANMNQGDDTPSAQQQDTNKGSKIGSMHGGLLNATNGTGVHGANWNASTGRANLTTLHGVGNRTVGWRVLARRNWKKRLLHYYY